MIFMDTPTYEGTIVVGGKDQNTISSIATILPELLINKQSGKLILTFVDAAGDPFSLLSITSLDAFAKPFESAETEINMGTGAISGAGDNVYTVSWVRDKFPAGWSTFSEDRDGAISFMVRLQETGTEDYYQWSTRFNIQDSELSGNASVLPDLSLVFYYNPIYIYDNNTTAADPGAGKFRFNNTTLSSVTEMYAADKNESNVDLQTYWQGLGIGSIIYFGNPNVKLEGAFFEVSGGVTDNTGFSTVPLTFVSAGTSQFTNGSSFSLTIDMIASVAYADGESIDDNNGNELITFGVAASAVNNLKTSNAATAGAPKIEVIGGDTDIALEIDSKGAANIKMLSTVQWAKGADLASATALPLINDGNYVDVTGTTTITSFDSVGVGTVQKLHFDAALILTHNATDLVLPGGANITTAAGDEFTFVEYAAGDWRCTGYALANGKSIIVDGAGVGVYRDIYIDAAAMVPRETNGAAALTKEFATNDIMIDYLSFDSTTEEGVQFKMMMPDEWDLSTIKFKFYWDAAATASGTVIWGVKAGSYSDSDPIDAALGTQITVTDTLLAVGDVHISPATAAVTVGGTPALEDMIIFQIVATTGGTIAVDQFLMGVSIQYKEGTTLPVIW